MVPDDAGVVDGRANRLDQRTDRAGRHSPGLDRLDGRGDGTAPLVAHDHDQGDLEFEDAELQTAEHGGVDDVSRRPDREEIAEALVQHGLDGDPAVDAAEAGGSRTLPGDQFLTVRQGGQRLP